MSPRQRSVKRHPSPCSTEQVEWLPRGHLFRTDFTLGSENQGLTRFVRDREWCPVAITNSLCVNRERVSQLLNTAESGSHGHGCSGGHPLLRCGYMQLV